uniref:COMM domain-containing protein 4 n=1 Tax=Cacopsylla melanoneura TaxID=428564 RepID=A0A8D8WPE7_9HEMI
MRFKFCGDDDCPDWLLGQVNNLSKLTHIKLKLLLQTIVKNILSGAVDYEKIQKLTADAKFSDAEVKGCVSGLTFIMGQSVKFSVESSHLNNELQQIGFPKEHAQVITDTFKDSHSKLVNHFISNMLKCNALTAVKCSRLNANFVHLVLTTTSSAPNSPSSSLVNGEMSNSSPGGNSTTTSHSLVISQKHYTLLLQDLIDVQKRIEDMSAGGS